MTKPRRKRHWWLVVVIAVIGAAAGVAVGATRQRVYSSSATMSAGPITALTPAQASNQANDVILASDYAQLITSDTVTRLAAARLHTSAGYVSSHLSAAAEAGSALFDITGHGPSASAARALTLAATVALRGYVGTLLANQHAQPQLLSQYQRAEQSSQQLKARITRLQNRPVTASNTATLQRLQAQLAVAQLKVEGLASLFMQGDQITSISQGAAPTMVSAPLVGTSPPRRRRLSSPPSGCLPGSAWGSACSSCPGRCCPRERPRDGTMT